MPVKKIRSQKSGIKSIIIFILLLFVFSVSHLIKVAAQDTSCDLCGWCGTNISAKPRDWESCARCIFPTMTQNLAIVETEGGYLGPKPTVNPANPYYPSTPEVSRNWTVFGCLDTAPGGFVSQLYRIIVSISSGFALLALIYGGFTVLTAGGDLLKVKSGKNIIMGAILGILLIVFSVFLLRLIGFEIIKIPGFG